MAKEKEAEKKSKRPTALKRDVTSEKKRVINKSFKSKSRTVFRAFETAQTLGEKPKVTESLSQLYSILDKGVKKGIYKPNKANRLKARAAAKLAKTA